MKKPFLIDDKQNFLYAFSRLIQREEFNILTAKNGFDPLQMLEQGAPDLIVCDMMMPGMNGFEFKNTLNQQFVSRDIPSLFVSAKTSRDDNDQAIELGVLDYIRKPVDYDERLLEIAKVMELTPI